MDACFNCKITPKLEYCCGSHPETGESQRLYLKRKSVSACPHLNRFGTCDIYERRPEPCQVYECPRLEGRDTFERLGTRFDFSFLNSE